MRKEDTPRMLYLIDEEIKANREAAEGMLPEAGALTVGCLVLSYFNRDFIAITALSSIGFIILCREANLKADISDFLIEKLVRA